MPSTKILDRAGASRGRARRLASLAAAGAALLAGAMLAAAAPASADSAINPSGNTAVYTLENMGTATPSMVADDLNASGAAGNPIGVWPSKGGNNQQWTIITSTGADAGYYTIQNDSSGLCLDVAGASTAQNAAVDQWTCNGQDNQEWQINYTGKWNGNSPLATIVSKNSGLLLNVSTDGQGSQLVQGGREFDDSDDPNSGLSTYWNVVRSTGGMPFVMSATSPHETLLDEGPVP